MAEASALRKKEAAAYAKELSEDSANIAATAKATAAVEQGMGSAFLQSPTASVVLRVARERQQDDVVSFLSGTDQYAPASGEELTFKSRGMRSLRPGPASPSPPTW